MDAFSSSDPLPPGPLPYATITNPQSLNKYTYTWNNPLRYTDPNGHFIETLWDAASAFMGFASAISNAKEGNYKAAAVDAVGAIVDTAAVLLPGVPGGVGTAIKAARAADKLDDVADAAQSVRNGSNILENAAKGKAAEQAVEAELKSEGAEILGRNVTAKTQEGTRRIDRLVDQGNGPKAIEVKSGNAKRSARQRAKDDSMAQDGATLVGKNAPKDLRNRKMKIKTEVRKPKE